MLRTRQYDEIRLGFEDDRYSKPCIFDPAISVRFAPGKHECTTEGQVQRGTNPELKLLHYRMLGGEYFTSRSNRNYSRFAKRNHELGLGLECAPDWTGEYSSEWYATEGVRRCVDVFQASRTYAEVLEKIHCGINPYDGFETVKWPNDWHGWDSCHHWFRELTDQIRPRIVVEVGTYKGGSARHVAEGLKERGMDSVVIAVDTWLGDRILWTFPEHRPSLKITHGRPEIYNTFMSNTIVSGLKDYIIPLPMDSASACKYLQQLCVQSEMIYIDGSHEGGCAYRDIIGYFDNVLLHGGVLIVDDYEPSNPMFEEIVRDVRRFSMERNLSFEVSGVKALFRKPW